MSIYVFQIIFAALSLFVLFIIGEIVYLIVLTIQLWILDIKKWFRERKIVE